MTFALIFQKLVDIVFLPLNLAIFAWLVQQTYFKELAVYWFILVGLAHVLMSKALQRAQFAHAAFMMTMGGTSSKV